MLGRDFASFGIFLYVLADVLLGVKFTQINTIKGGNMRKQFNENSKKREGNGTAGKHESRINSKKSDEKLKTSKDSVELDAKRTIRSLVIELVTSVVFIVAICALRTRLKASSPRFGTERSAPKARCHKKPQS